MSAQLELFAIPKATPQPTTKPKPVRRNNELREIEPLDGTKDRSGKYWHERFHAAVIELRPSDQDMVFDMLTIWDYKRMNAVRKLLNRWDAASHSQRDDFAEGVGR